MKLIRLTYDLRHAIQISVALLIALLVNRYFAFSPNGWIVVTTLIVLQISRGTPLRQLLMYSMLIIFSVCFSYILIKHLNTVLLLFIASLLFIVSMFFVLSQRMRQNNQFFFIIPLYLPFLIGIFFPQTTLQYQLIDVLIGALIGLFCAAFIYPVQLNKEFQSALLPILYQILSFMRKTRLYENVVESERILTIEKKAIEIALLADNNLYPEWIYETGFNPGFRAGFRFFLLHIERITELLFSLSYYLMKPIDLELISKFEEPFNEAINKNCELLTILIDYLRENHFSKISSDFTTDIQNLENLARKTLPSHLELLDIADEYITLTIIIRNLKDLRKILLDLLLALPPFSEQNQKR